MLWNSNFDSSIYAYIKSASGSWYCAFSTISNNYSPVLLSLGCLLELNSNTKLSYVQQGFGTATDNDGNIILAPCYIKDGTYIIDNLPQMNNTLFPSLTKGWVTDRTLNYYYAGSNNGNGNLLSE